MEGLMANPLIRKLQQVIRLAADDQRLLEQATAERVTRFAPREDLMSEGDELREIYLLLSGWACRYKQLEDGRRAILAFLLPGDLCDPGPFILSEMDHSVGTLTSGTLVTIPRAVFEDLTFHHPRIAQAL